MSGRRRGAGRRGGPSGWTAALLAIPMAIAAPLPSYRLAAQAPTEPPASVVEVDGVRVLHLRTPASEAVSARLHLLGGVQEASAPHAGLEALLLRSTAWGTEGLPGPATREAEAAAGVEIYVEAAADWTTIGFDGITETFDQAWAVLAQRVARPGFDSTGIEIERSRMLTSVRAGDDSPDARVARMARELAFRDHPYAIPPEGTVESLQAITVESLRAFHEEKMVRSRMALVVLGDIPLERVEAMVREGLGGLPEGAYTWSPPPPWTADAADVVTEARPLPTNYILGYFAGPASRDPGYPAFRFAVQTLGSFLNAVLRAEGLTYAAGSPVVARAASGGGIYMTTRAPERAMEQVEVVIEALRSGTFRRNTLQEAAEQARLDYWYQTETTSEKADFIGTNWLLTGEVLDAASYVQRLKEIEPHLVRRAALEYFENVRWAYLGDVQQLPESEMRRF